MSHAARIEETAARYLLRRQEPGWSAADQSELDAWLAESTEHEVSYLRLEYGWSKADRLAALRGAVSLPSSPSIYKESIRGAGSFKKALWGGAVAASLAMVSLLAWHNGAFDTLARPAYTTQIGGHQTVPLPDGSRIELNTNTCVRTDMNDKARAVWIERGEAYFDVAHDALRPFVVHAGERRITVLGTRFSVRRDADHVVVAVIEGRVRLEPAQSTDSPAIVKGGDTAIVQGPATRIASERADQIAQHLSWRHGMLTFDQTTLAEAANEFNRYNRKQLRVAETAASVRIGGSFEATNVDAFVRLLQQGFGLQAVEAGGTIDVSRR